MEEALLISQDDYLKSGVHIGTKFKTKYMHKFIYKTRPDGLSVLNLQQIDQRLKIAIKFLSQYDPEDIIVMSRRENGWKPAKKMGHATGIRVITGRYPPGILTNPNLDKYTEAKLILVCDPWPDRNAVKDASQMGITIMGLCDTNNESNNLDFVIPCNNKGKKALGLVFFLLARGYLKARGAIKKDEEFTSTVEDFTQE